MTARPSRQSSAISTPAAVATPLPPRKPSHTGKTCPRNAARPTSASISAEAPSAPATSTAAQPFAASPASVRRAAMRFPERSTLVAPMFLEP